jgi:phosphoglycerol transferase MdoB-like AlkP superfamily enzyme
VIVITADHYPYGLTDEEYSELLGKTVTQADLDIYKNGCIIYKPGMEGQNITELSSHLDLLPTLSNMFGLEFDSRLYIGRDIFSDAPALVMFQNRSWITEFASYNASTKKYSYFTDMEIPQEYLDYIKNEVSNRFTISQRILDKDYWSILFPEE